jgi:hypothetical protein
MKFFDLSVSFDSTEDKENYVEIIVLLKHN